MKLETDDVLVLDVDGCLFDFTRAWFALRGIPEEHQLPVTRFSFFRDYGVSPDEFAADLLRMSGPAWDVSLFANESYAYTGDWRVWNLIEQATKGGNEIVVATSRPIPAREATGFFLTRMGVAYEQLFIGSHDKAIQLLEHGIDPGDAVVVEDQPDQVRRYIDAGFNRLVIPPHLYNEEVQHLDTWDNYFYPDAPIQVSAVSSKPSPLDVLGRWPRAVLLVSQLSLRGDEKHKDDGRAPGRGRPIDLDRYDWDYSIDKMLRHLARVFVGEEFDPEMNVPHEVMLGFYGLNALEALCHRYEVTVDDILEGRLDRGWENTRHER